MEATLAVVGNQAAIVSEAWDRQEERVNKPTSTRVVRRAGQSSRFTIVVRNGLLSSRSSCASSASRGCSGNDADVALHAFTAHVIKLRLRIFIVNLV